MANHSKMAGIKRPGLEADLILESGQIFVGEVDCRLETRIYSGCECVCENMYTSQGLFKCDSFAIILLQFRPKFDVDFRVWFRYNTNENRERKIPNTRKETENEKNCSK